MRTSELKAADDIRRELDRLALFQIDAAGIAGAPSTAGRSFAPSCESGVYVAKFGRRKAMPAPLRTPWNKPLRLFSAAAHKHPVGCLAEHRFAHREAGAGQTHCERTWVRVGASEPSRSEMMGAASHGAASHHTSAFFPAAPTAAIQCDDGGHRPRMLTGARIRRPLTVETCRNGRRGRAHLSRTGWQGGQESGAGDHADQKLHR